MFEREGGEDNWRVLTGQGSGLLVVTRPCSSSSFLHPLLAALVEEVEEEEMGGGGGCRGAGQDIPFVTLCTAGPHFCLFCNFLFGKRRRWRR